MSTPSHNGQIAAGRVGVLLIHGLCGSPAEMRFVANGLSREGYTVHSPVLAGHGGTSDELKATNWQDWLRSAEEGLDELAKTCDTIIAAGLSTGALLALMLAHRHPEKVKGIALFSPTLWLNGKKIPWKMRLARRFLAFKAVARHFDLPAPQAYGIKDERIRDFVSKASRASGNSTTAHSTPGLVALERRWLAKEVIGVLSQIKQPALIIHPREDCLADINNAFYLQRNLAGAADLVVLDDSYHIVTIDRQRHIVVEETARFTARVGDRSRGVRAPVRPAVSQVAQSAGLVPAFA